VRGGRFFAYAKFDGHEPHWVHGFFGGLVSVVIKYALP